MSDGQLALNTNDASPGLFFKDSNGGLVKVGPVHVGTTAPNASPASGGATGNTKGEQWLDTSGTNPVLKIWDGSAWQSEAGEFVNASGDVMTGALGIIAGSAGSPGLYFSGDTNTGIYSPGADQVAISTNSTGRLFVDSSGRVGVGVSSPAAPLDLSGDLIARNSTIRIKDSGNTSQYLAIYGDATSAHINGGVNNLVFYSAGTERGRFDSSGRLGIGSSTPGSYDAFADDLVIANGSGNPGITLAGSTTGWGSIYFADGTTGSEPYRGYIQYGHTNDRMTFATAGSGAMHIDSSQRVGIGTTSASATLHVSGSGAPLILNCTSANSNNIIFQINGSARGYIGPAGNLGGSDNDMGYRVESGNNQVFYVGASEAARIDSSRRFLVGTSSSSANARAVIQGRTTSATDQGVLYLQRGSSGPGVVADGSGIGEIWFADSNGYAAANIMCLADNTWGGAGGDYPGRLVFSVTRDSQASPTEAMRINNQGGVSIDSVSSNTTNSLYLAHSGGGNPGILLVSGTNGTYAGTTIESNITRAATSAASVFKGFSGNFADAEFNLRGDGNGYCDGAWTGGGADYAEYFEWSDNNPEAEDRRGISVVLDGDKIREAVAGEDPIGVISGNPSVVGDAAWNKWSGKYLRDEFGTYIQEDYEVVNDEGETVVQQRRKLNPAYDPDQEYISREQRPEWDCVGLMGKLRIRKGQVTGSRWTKMRDISDSVEEWLVR